MESAITARRKSTRETNKFDYSTGFGVDELKWTVR
jgi:hypothetical protein